MSVKNKTKKLAKKQCANFNTSNNKCFVTDEPCTYFEDKFIGHCRCNYFERSVLPGDQVLELKYWQEIAGTKNIYDHRRLANCAICDGQFSKNNNKHKYCDHCAYVADRDSSRESMKKKRQSQQD
jgi:hypothetical protein